MVHRSATELGGSLPTHEDVRRADQVARDMALESQNLTDETYREVLLRRMVELRLSTESSTTRTTGEADVRLDVDQAYVDEGAEVRDL